VEGRTVAVLNIGGISNLTALGADGSTIGFDCGPGNALMDHWCLAHTGRAYDDAGAWAASGHVVEPLLSGMLADPYFSLPAPKSTGRDRFHPDWLAAHLQALGSPPPPADVQATLAELTATCCANDVRRHAANATWQRICLALRSGPAANAACLPWRSRPARSPGSRGRSAPGSLRV
jgi:anhydro-N-acetylmuramic acid kinase